MISVSDAFSALPSSLRDELLQEYRAIVQNYLEHRWLPSELGGGKLCEVVFTILDGYAKGTYERSARKPQNFVKACRGLEAHSHVPRSFQILIPRLMPALYEIRNNRGVGHVGGDVDPNHMDATAVLSMSSWIMAELVRVLHNLPMDDAQALVSSLADRRTPLVWDGDSKRRVLDTSLSLKDQLLVLIASTVGRSSIRDLQAWTESDDKRYFLKQLRKLHALRLIEVTEVGGDGEAQILPPGSVYVEQLISRRLGSVS